MPFYNIYSIIKVKKKRCCGMDMHILEEIKNRIIQKIKPKAIILFGSTARREEKEDSDFDLLIVWDVKDMSNVERRIKIRKAIGFVDKPVDIVTCTTEELVRALEDKRSFTSIIVNEGVIIHGRLDGLSQMAQQSQSGYQGSRDNSK